MSDELSNQEKAGVFKDAEPEVNTLKEQLAENTAELHHITDPNERLSGGNAPLASVVVENLGVVKENKLIYIYYSMKKTNEIQNDSNNQRKFRFRISTAKNCLKNTGCIWIMNCDCSNCIKFENNLKKYK